MKLSTILLLITISLVSCCLNPEAKKGISILPDKDYKSFLIYVDANKFSVEGTLTVDAAEVLAEKELSKLGYCPKGVEVKEDGVGRHERSSSWYSIRAKCRV